MNESIVSDPFTVGSIAMSSDTKEIFSALAKAQAKIEPIHKDRTADAGKYSYNYATLDAVWEAVRPALTENDICTIQSPCVDGDDVSVTTMLGHSSGQWIAGTITLRAIGKTSKEGVLLPVDAQSVGSAVSYGRRYTLMAIVGVTPDEDDDGSGGNVTTKPKSGLSQVPCPGCQKTSTVIKDKFAVEDGRKEGSLVCYKKKGGCGRKWHPDDVKPKAESPAETPQQGPMDEVQSILKERGCKTKEDAACLMSCVTDGIYDTHDKYRRSDEDAIAVLGQLKGNPVSLESARKAEAETAKETAL